MTHFETTIHGCTGLRVARYFPDINNCITIEVSTATGPGFMLQMFGHDRDVTDDLMEQFADEETLVRRHSVLDEIITLTKVAGDDAA